MSNASRRNIERLDYKVLSETGEKVIKSVSDSEIENLASSLEKFSIMSSVDKLKFKERRVAKDIKDYMDVNDLEEMLDIEEISEYIEELMSNYRKYRDIHEDLKDALGVDEYEKSFPKGAQTLDMMKSNIKKAKMARSRIQEKHRKEQIAKEEAREERLRKEKEDREERLRKEKEDREERLRKEKEEREERIRKEQEAKEEAREERLRKEKEDKEERLRKERKEELLRREEKEEKVRKEQAEREERLRKEQEQKEEKFRKEQEQKEEKFRKEQEQKEEKLRKEQEERERKVRKEKIEEDLKNEERRKAELEEKSQRDLEQREMKLRDEIEFCLCKMDTIVCSFPIAQLSMIEDIRMNVGRLSDEMASYNHLVKILKLVVKSDVGYDSCLESVCNYIESANNKVGAIIKEKDAADLGRVAREKEELAKKSEEEERQKEKEELACKRMIDEIVMIEDELYNIKWVEVSALDDRELLGKEKDLKLHECTFSGLSEKLTDLYKQLPQDYLNKTDITGNLSKKEKEVKDILENYKEKLRCEIADRNVSKEKLASTQSLEVKLSKFSGYNSLSDIYTFQSEFEKLYSTSLQKKLLPDFLKHNYLEGQALTLVKNMEDLDEIWNRLKVAFGDPELLLTNKLKIIEKVGSIWKLKDKRKLVQVLTRLSFAMLELESLAEKYDIENDLYHGGGIQRVYNVIGFQYRDRFIRKTSKYSLSKKQLWKKLIEFIQTEVNIYEKINLVEQSFQPERFNNSNSVSGESRKSYNACREENSKACVLCGKSDHVITVDHFGRQVVQYFSCKMFTELTPKERFKLLFDKNLCYQCLSPGASVESGKHKSGTCFSKFICKQKSHSKYPRKKHILLCEEHKKNIENLDLLEKYKKENILCLKSQLPDFSKNIKLSFHCDSTEQFSDLYLANPSKEEVTERSVYILQTICINGKRFNLFFDTGCGDLVCRKEAIFELASMGKANLIVEGPIVLGGVGDVKTVSKYGVYKVDIPLHTGEIAAMRGVCLDQVTAKFPVYPLKEQVEGDIIDSYELAGHDSQDLPKLPERVGGDTDLMLGIKYLKYYPEFVFRLPTGLTIYRSQFLSPDGSRGVVGGPHHVFTEIEKHCAKSFMSLGTYFVQQLTLVRMGYQVNPDVQLLGGAQESIGDLNISDCAHYDDSYSTRRALKKSKLFESIETAGSEVTYRCINCRDCSNCKKSEQIQCISIQEEIEQDIIDSSVEVNISNGVTTARLPFLENPLTKLCSNKENAMAVYRSQVKRLDRNPGDKSDVIESEQKMQKLGFVDKVENLAPLQKEAINNSRLQYFIPWRAVWNPNSLSTPCRLVFDASQVTKSGFSLNSVLAKGRNNMNKLVEILIRWSSHRVGFHTDIRKMYNTVKLAEKDWCYQLYLWHDQLSVGEEPVVKVIKTLIYGVKSSGNQAESALRKTSKIEDKNYPRVSNIIQKDIYVDDCLSGENTWVSATSTTDDLQLVLARGGFAVKGFTFSGRKPPSEFSSDGISVKVAGLKWYTEEDKVSLETGNLNFSKKVRGKKSTNVDNQIPHDFTRRDCVSKVAEVFDLVGKVTPITCGLKLDLRTLVNRKLDWDDNIPSDLKTIWLSNFKTIRELVDVKFSRAIVPEDAVSLDINTIDKGDASKSLVCSAIYARFLRRDGSYSCQLVFSRSKLVPEGMTLPRAELLAANLNASTGHVVKLALGDLHKECIKLTDSQITLHWISNTKNPLKQWVRNKVVEINRLADRSLWRYIQSKDMLADLGTRKGATIVDVSDSSEWINGLKWMRADKKDFPVKSVNDLKLKSADLEYLKAESLRPDCIDQILEIEKDEIIDSVPSYTCRKVDSKVLTERYLFSNYILDPNRFRLRKVVRILALVILFVRKLLKRVKRQDMNVSTDKIPKELTNQKYVVTTGSSFTVVKSAGKSTKLKCKPGQVICLSDSDIKLALDYFFRKCTEEIKQFSDKKTYKKVSEERNGILYYTGRILPSQEFGGNQSLSDVMIDLTSSTFAVPLVDFSSPFAYSIVNEVHWFHPVAKHSGIETVLRYTMTYAHIIEGRDLVRSFKKDCARCRILAKRTIDVIMGPISKVNLTIAPAFFISQVDLFGPFKSYSVHNKRASISLWFLIFCCCTTGAASIKVMESYSTSSFLLGFIRFSCSFGYPKMILPDEGSQLVKGCKEMELNYNDIRHRLNTEYGVQFETCPVGGHNMHGKVERKIQHVKAAMNKELSNERLSVIQWETLGDQIANCVNDTPLAVRYVPKDIEQMDLLTPNRLMLGRNNERSPAGPLCVSNDPDKIITQNADIMRVWFECWLVSHVPKLMEQPKWYSSDRDMKVGDVVLFLRKEREYAGNYQYGLVKSVEVGRDQKIRSVILEYQNHTESVKRKTRRAVREIVVVHPVNELGIIRELGEIATYADMISKIGHV